MAWMVTLNIGMVVVRKADMPSTSGWCSWMAATNLAGGTLTPRSMTLKPAPSSMMSHRFLPMSCMSPLTVPMTHVPSERDVPPWIMSGLRMFSAPCMARAAISISGTKNSPVSKRRPTSSRPGISPCQSISSGVRPRASPSLVSATTGGALPHKTFSFRPAIISARRSIPTSFLVAPVVAGSLAHDFDVARVSVVDGAGGAEDVAAAIAGGVNAALDLVTDFVGVVAGQQALVEAAEQADALADAPLNIGQVKIAGAGEGGDRLQGIGAGGDHILQEQRPAPAIVIADQIAGGVASRHDLFVIGLDEFAIHLRREAHAHPGLVH